MPNPKTFQDIGHRLGEQLGEHNADELAVAKRKYEDDIVNQDFEMWASHA